MSVRPFADQEREVLRELAALFALRAEREQSLAARLATGLADAQRDHQETTEQARSAFEKAVAKATAEHDAARTESEAAARAKMEGARRAMGAEIGAFEERTQSMSEAIAAKLRDARWLAETMLESGEGRARAAFEATRKAVAEWVGFFDTMEAGAQAALTMAKHAPMPSTRPSADEDAGAQAGVAQVKDVEAESEAVRRALWRLERALRPRLLEPAGLLSILALGMLAGAGVAGGRAWQQPDTVDVTRALIGTGIGAAVAVIVLVVLRIITRRRVPAAAQALHVALSGARETAARVIRSAAAARDADIAALRRKSSEEIVSAQAAMAGPEAEVQKRTREKLPQLRARHEQALDQIASERDQRIADLGRKLADFRAARQAELDAALRNADDRLAHTQRQLEAADRTDRDGLEATWASRITAATRWADDLARTCAAISPPWETRFWEQPTAASATPPGVRFGSLRLDLAALPGGLSTDPRLAVPGSTDRDLPLMIDLLGKGSVLLRATPDQRDAAIAALNNITLRLLTGLPPGKARFTIVDPVGLGQSFAGLMHLSDYEEALVGERIWTDPRHIEQRLTDLTEHMETVIQKYLRNEYETIQAYNAEAGEVAEPYRFLVIADLPTSITENAAKRLASIATSGARCGVFLLAMTTQPAPKAGESLKSGGVPWGDIERNSLVLRITGKGVQWAEEPFAPWPVELEPPPDEAETMRILHRIGEHAKDSTRVQVPFAIVEPPDDRLWSGDTASEIRLPLGRAGAKKVQHMTLGRGTAQHALIAGRTGSGKSTLLHVIITTAALWYSPDQVELYLVDFKKGVEFKTYAAHRLPHARVVAVESEREFGLSVLRRLDAELTRRGALFRDAGVQDLAAYRRWQAQSGDVAPMPRILLVVDEFQEFFVEDDKLAQDAGLLLDRLVRQGRAFGMHVILGSQTLGGAYTLARTTLGQMAVRIALQCSESDSYLILSEDNPAPRLLSRPGEAIYNDNSGLIEGNSPFQIVWLPDEVRDTALSRVQSRVAAAGRPPAPQVVFEGNIPGDLARNELLMGLVERRTPRRPVPVLWLGEPVAIKEPTGILLRHQSAANALIVGNHDEHAAAISASIILSLAAWLRAGVPGATSATAGSNGHPSAPHAAPTIPPITILDATPPDLPHADLLPRLAKGLGAAEVGDATSPSGAAATESCANTDSHDRGAGPAPGPSKLARLIGSRGVADALSTITAEIDRRAASGTTAHTPLLLLIHGLHRFRDLRKSDEFSFSSDSDGSAPSPSQQLMTILRTGPSVGVHAVIWIDTATSVDRMLERSALREFGARVLMQMSAGDSTQLMEGPQAATLGHNRALLYSDETGTVEKFRLYAAPEAGWVEGVVRRVMGEGVGV